MLVFSSSSGVRVSMCASTKGKEKREESVAYHRQRAALDKLQEKHNLASLERERWRTKERLQGARIENALVHERKRRDEQG